MPKFIVLSSDNITLVDDDVYAWASRHKWHEVHGYAARNCRTADGKRCKVSLHQAIMQTPKGMETDHIDHDTLNNLRSNLRIVTSAQNHQNRSGAQGNSRLGVRGVTLNHRRYRARITLARTIINMGTFFTLKEADAAAKEGRRRFMTHSPECTEKALST